MNRSILLSAFFCLIAVALHGQQFTYSTGFETPAERAGWVMSTHPDLDGSKFIVGQADHYMGQHSMYVSKDSAANNYLGHRYAAYKSFELEVGTYDISFCMLMPWGRARVGIVPDSIDVSSAFSANFTSVSTQSLFLDDDSLAYHGRNNIYYEDIHHWRPLRGSYTITQQGTYKIFFEAYGGYNSKYNMSPDEKYGLIAIDNFQISKRGNACVEISTPTITERAGEIELAWTGTATQYELMWGRTNDSTDWQTHTVSNIASPYVVSTAAFDAGVYSFRVRAICGADTGMWREVEYKKLSELAYFTSFESADDNSEWHAVQTTTKQRYVVGRYDHCIGSRAAYLSSNSGNDNTILYPYTQEGYNIVHKFTLDTGRYEVLFDYKCPDYTLIVGLAPAAEKFVEQDYYYKQNMSIYAAQTANIRLDDIYSGYHFSLPLSEVWQKVKIEFNVEQKGEYNLYFRSIKELRSLTYKGPEIDNIQIALDASPTDCQYVDNLQSTEQTTGTTLSWDDSGADSYDVLVYCVNNAADTIIYKPVGGIKLVHI